MSIDEREYATNEIHRLEGEVHLNDEAIHALLREVQELKEKLEYTVAALSRADTKIQELKERYAPPAIEVIDGVMEDKSQDADWLRARYFEQCRRIEELEEGACRYNCRTSRATWIAGFREAVSNTNYRSTDAEEVYREWKRQ